MEVDQRMDPLDRLLRFILSYVAKSTDLRYWTVAVMVLLVHASIWGQTTSQPFSTITPPKAVEEAHKNIELGKEKEAIDSLEQLAQVRPIAPGVNRELGIAFYRTGRLTEAEKSFAAAMNDDPDDAESIQMRGLTVFRLGRFSDAIPYLERARQTPRHSDIDANYVLGRCYMEASRYDDARVAFANQYGLAPESGPAYLLIAQMLVIRELPEIAAINALKALQLSPHLALAHFLLGKIFLAKGELDHALEQFEAERTINPTNPQLYQFLGDLYIKEGKFGLAQQSLTRALSLDQSSTEPFILMGRLFLDDEDPQTASSYLEHAEGMDPSNFITHYLLAQAYRSMGMPDEAKKEFDLVAKMHSGTH
jgi:tetratricopeptide (TPR) repeat protein